MRLALITLITAFNQLSTNQAKAAMTKLNPLHPSVAFHIETKHSIFIANQMTGFNMKWKTGLKNGLSNLQI